MRLFDQHQLERPQKMPHATPQRQTSHAAPVRLNLGRSRANGLSTRRIVGKWIIATKGIDWGGRSACTEGIHRVCSPGLPANPRIDTNTDIVQRPSVQRYVRSGQFRQRQRKLFQSTTVCQRAWADFFQ